MKRLAFTLVFFILLSSFGSADWWDSDWGRKYKLNDWNVTLDLNVTNMIRAEGVDFSSMVIVCSDANDFTVVNENTSTEVTDFNFEGWDGTNTDQDVNILFRPTAALATGDYNNEYAFYTNNSDCSPSPASSRTDWQSSFDDFEDGDFTNAPNWREKLVDAPYSVDVNAQSKKNGSYGLTIALTGAGDVYYTETDANGGEIDARLWVSTTDASSGSYFYIANTAGNAISYILLDQDKFTVTDHGEVIGCVPTDDTWYLLNIKHSDARNKVSFYIYNEDLTICGSAVEQTPDRIGVGLVWIGAFGRGAVETYFDDVSFSEPYAFGYVLEASPPAIRMQFRDENSGTVLNGLSVLFDGTTYTTDSDGVLDLNVEGLSGEKTIKAWQDDNYTARYFDFDVNSSTSLDVDLYMLKDVNGIDIDFQFYESDETTILASSKVFVYADDANIISIDSTDTDGKMSLFLDPDMNYYFVSGSQRYDTITVTFNRPKDETDLTFITPYNLAIERLATRSFSGLAATLTTYLFPNTEEHYRFDLNAGATYYPRKREIKYKGNPQTAEIQMYLTPVTDGIESVFYTKNAADLTTYPGVTIRVFRELAGEGRVEIQSVVTDDAGTAILSFVQDKEYEFEFYDSNATLLFTKTLTINFAAYYVYIDVGEVEWSVPTQESIAISVTPTEGYLMYDASGTDINVTVTVANGAIATSWFTISNDANSDHNFTNNWDCGSGCGYTFPISDLNDTSGFTVSVYVVTSTGLKKLFTKNYTPMDSSGFNWIDYISSPAFRTEWGCSKDTNEPCFFLLTMSAFMTIAVIVAAGAGLTTNKGAIGVLAMVVLGLFAFLNWVPGTLYVLACLGAFASLIISRRV